ncbi:Putative Glucose-6-phosphate 1-dehydrogenase [Rhizopus microsporus]|nr:Putative Glucose-6-phosphate 1-dehydrogenase [Rhizopus microsporus]
MLRASKVYNGAIRSSLQSKQPLGTIMTKRFETTVAQETTKKSKFFGKFVGVTVLLGAGFGGTTYYALHDKEFRKAFTTYVPGAKEAVNFVEDVQKNYNIDQYMNQASDWKRQAEDIANTAKEYTTKIQETTNGYYQALTGQKDSDRPDSKHLVPAEAVVEKHALSTPTDTVTTMSMSSDNETKPVVVEVAIEKPEPIQVRMIKSDNTTVRELSQIVVELASILNQSGLSGLGREVIKEAESKIEKLNESFLTIDTEQAAILKSIQSLKEKGDRVEDSLEEFHAEALKTIDDSQAVAASTIIAREAQLRNQFEQTRNDQVIQTVLKVIPKELAEEGVNTVSELAVRFEEVAQEIRRVALVPEDGGFGSHIISSLMSYLMFKKSGLVEGDDVESILAHAEYYLKRDNLEYATRELNQLGGWPKRLARDWIQSARRHLEVKQALEVAETQAVLLSLLEV